MAQRSGVHEFRRERSAASKVASFVRFKNLTQKSVSIIWVDFKGLGHPYGAPLEPGRVLDVNTFAGHKWAFRAADTGYHLCTTNGQNVWSARPWTESRGPQSHLAQRVVVGIRTPVYRLEELCLMSLKRMLRNKDADGTVAALELPATLKADLADSNSLDYIGKILAPLPQQ